MPPVRTSPARCRIAAAAASAVARRHAMRARCSQRRMQAYLLFGVEPSLDIAAAATALRRAGAPRMVVAVTPFAGASSSSVAHVLLPIAHVRRDLGHLRQLEGRWQSFARRGSPLGEARPGWKVLRVLGNLLEPAGFEYHTLGATCCDGAAQRELARQRPSSSRGALSSARFAASGSGARAGCCDARVRRRADRTPSTRCVRRRARCSVDASCAQRGRGACSDVRARVLAALHVDLARWFPRWLGSS